MLSLFANKAVIGAVGGALVLVALSLWFNARLKDEYEAGYQARQTELIAQHAKKQRQLLEENERLRNEDRVRVETVIEEKIVTETVIEEVIREIPTVDTTACTALSDDWVRLYNAAARANCRADTVSSDCAILERTLSAAPDA